MATNWNTVFEMAEAAAREAIAKEVAVRPEDPWAFDCGFAWVTVRPARGSFISFCKREIKKLGGQDRREAARYGDNGWNGGWVFWRPGDFDGQSVRIHRVGAEAFARVLQEHGVYAEVSSRLD